MDIINLLIFIALAGLTILSALVVVFAPRIVYSVVASIVCFLSVSGIFLQLNADFVGVSQIVIYGVGVSILFVFALMLTSQKEEKKLWLALKPRTLIGLASVAMLFLVTIFCITGGGAKLSNSGVFKIKKVNATQVELLKSKGTTEIIGQRLFIDYVLPFELLSLLLLAGIIGAGVLGIQAKEDEK